MRRLLCATAALALAVTLAPAEEKKEPTIKDIMAKANKGNDSPFAKVGVELKSEAPKWDDVQKETGQLVDLVSGLGKCTPTLGDKESWDKLSKQYLEATKALDADAQKKDQDAAKSDYKKTTETCRACHSVHRPKPKNP